MKKVCVVTGGANGIGAAVVEKFLSNGFKVYSLDLVPSPKGVSVLCDVSNESSVEDAIALIKSNERRIDCLVINAGIHFYGNIEQTTTEDFDRVLGINVRGAYFGAKKSLPLMKNNGGSIVLISSDQAFIGKSNSFAYNMSKTAVASMAKTIAIDYAQFGIRCNAICPGTIDTPLYRSAMSKAVLCTGKTFDELHAEACNLQLLNRLGTAIEVADYVDFLCSDKAGFITGSLQSIDGGYTTI
jgi:NAD(P)-dependent dehydrogenase (short-subunit alcohol dehydrogenase family)